MADREELIARKQEVRRQIVRLQRDLTHLQQANPPNDHRIRTLQEQLERLMAQEYNLRLQIDRSR